jgi:hypothetical protein
MEHDQQMLDLGIALGQQHAFGLIAGRCSAAQAETLRRVREEKLYLKCSPTWAQFCAGYVGMSASQADRTIARLEEFGPNYFALSQLTRVSAETYRAIAPAVRDGTIECQGEIIELAPENVRKVAAAVAELRKAASPGKAPAPASGRQDLDELTRRFNELLADVRRAAEADGRTVGDTLRIMMCRMQAIVQETS